MKFEVTNVGSGVVNGQQFDDIQEYSVDGQKVFGLGLKTASISGFFSTKTGKLTYGWAINADHGVSVDCRINGIKAKADLSDVPSRIIDEPKMKKSLVDGFSDVSVVSAVKKSPKQEFEWIAHSYKDGLDVFFGQKKDAGLYAWTQKGEAGFITFDAVGRDEAVIARLTEVPTQVVRSGVTSAFSINLLSAKNETQPATGAKFQQLVP